MLVTDIVCHDQNIWSNPQCVKPFFLELCKYFTSYFPSSFQAYHQIKKFSVHIICDSNILAYVLNGQKNHRTSKLF